MEESSLIVTDPVKVDRRKHNGRKRGGTNAPCDPEVKAKRIADRHDAEFDRALRRLPDKAPVQVELDWIRAHPAMIRKARQDDPEQDIFVTFEDVVKAPHGRAPSRSAVHELQNWINRPGKFFDALMQERRKQKEQAEATRVEPDLGLAEVEILLRAVSVGQ